jgi:hypothetical protein
MTIEEFKKLVNNDSTFAEILFLIVKRAEPFAGGKLSNEYLTTLEQYLRNKKIG